MSTLSARLVVKASADLQPDAPYSLAIGHVLENATGGRGWKQGTGSGQVDRVYQVNGSLSSAATDSYNLLAAGSLTDVLGQAIDADELKALVLKCETGDIALGAPASNFLGIFNAANDAILLTAGQSVAFDLGATGIDVTTNASFDVAETSGAAAATYSLWLIVAQ